ncbi:MAG: hypothetical protein AAFV51_10955 [Pseudomonadota bacterium]
MPKSEPAITAFDHPPGDGATLDFLRAVAERGRATAMLSGVHLALWGGLISAAYLNHYAALKGFYGETFWTIGAGYGAMALIGWPASIYLGAARRPAVSAAGATVYAVVFAAAGLALSVFAVGSAFTPQIPGQATMIVGALMMGLCFLTTGALARMGWLLAVGAAWFVAAAALFFLIETYALLLVGAVVWAMLMAAPGVALMASNRRQARGAP